MDNENIYIRQAENDDIIALCELGKITFYDTYQAYNTAENMAAYVSKNYVPDTVLAELKNPESLYYIAFDGNDMLGFLKLRTTKKPTEIKELNPIEIERIYVLPGYKGKGIGHLLMTKAMEVAKHNLHKAIWLGVWEKNESALNFYTREGFKKFGEHVFMLGDDAQLDWLVYKKLD